ncbi:unnamed protein product [Blepharisma stoltei]|uniref:DNA primase large subunit C-terminal domain-containing protein n=1 Tax=Blepharisma stoltei TaxID=1481888 RepID=A0AAU9IEW1_9CILI|nr:unnamed protein product [Blepharisma stoltei]
MDNPKPAQGNHQKYLTHLPLFYEDPVDEVDIIELEEITRKRVDLLKKVELNMLEKMNLKYISIDPLFTEKYNDREKEFRDKASHFMLKLAYCSHAEEGKWWVNMETALFKMRLNNMTNPSEVLRQANISFEIKTSADIECPLPEDKEAIGNGIRYKVPLSLSACILKLGYFPIKGFCYVTREHIIDVIADLFRQGCDLALKEASKNIITDERLKSIINRITNPDADNVYENKAPKEKFVTLENLDMMAHNHFPPCMKRLFSNIKTNHHLKHFGRLQFGLFLKGVGLSLDDSLKFWRTEFCNKMTVEKFSKEYEYSIKHSYGKAGKMADYTPWGCRKIIHFPNPSDGEFHGCPFRHAARGELLRILNSYGINEETKASIMQKFPNEPERSCISLFKATHDNTPPDLLEHVGRHPNSYFDASIKYHNLAGR